MLRLANAGAFSQSKTAECSYVGNRLRGSRMHLGKGLEGRNFTACAVL